MGNSDLLNLYPGKGTGVWCTEGFIKHFWG